MSYPERPSPGPFSTRRVFWACLAFAFWGLFALRGYLREEEHLDYFLLPFAFVDQFAVAHFWTALMAGAAVFTGLAILKACGYRFLSRLEACLVSFGLGVVAFTVVLTVLGPLGLHGSMAIRLLTTLALLLPGALLFRRLRNAVSREGGRAFRISLPAGGLTEWACLALVALVVLMVWIGCLLPPSRPDPLIEHLPRARQYVEEGWKWPAPGHYNNARLLNAWAWAMGGGIRASRSEVLKADAPESPSSHALGGAFDAASSYQSRTPETVCALFVLCMALASLGAVVLWLRCLSAGARWPVAAAMVAACPVFQYVSDSVQTDAFVLFFALMGTWLLFRWPEERRFSHLFLSALFLGYALGCKPLAIYAFPAAATALALFCFRRDRRGRRTPGAWFAYALLLLILPGYTVGNFVRTGNPLYPYASGLFPSWKTASTPVGTPPSTDQPPTPDDAKGETPHARREASEVEAEFTREWVEVTRFGRRPVDWLLLPWRITVSGDYPNQWGNVIIPSFLMLAPLLLLLRGRDLAALLVFCVVYFGVWATQPQHIRYGLPGLALSAVLLTALLERRLRPSVRVGATWLMVLLPASLVTGYQAYERVRVNPLPYLAGRQSRHAYLMTSEARKTYQAYWHLIWGGRPDGATDAPHIRLFGEARGYHCPFRHVADDTNLTGLRRLRADAANDPVEGLEALRRAGYTHVLFNHALFNYFYLRGERHGASPALARQATRDLAFFEAMAAAGLKKVYDEAGVSIHEVSSIR